MAKVLIVDDDWDLVDAGRIILENAGYEVAGAHTRGEGMEAVKTFQPDLLILDVMMAQADDGIAMAQDLRRQGFRKPILMLTAIAKVSNLEFGKDSEMVPVDDFQEKPVEPAVLVDKVRTLLQAAEVR